MLNNGNPGPGRPGYDQNQAQLIQHHMQTLQLQAQIDPNRTIQNHFGFQNPPPQPQGILFSIYSLFIE